MDASSALDPVLLARLQFAFTITFHIIFPSFTIGLSAFIATLLVRWIATGREHLHRLARFWTKIFAVSFAMVEAHWDGSRPGALVLLAWPDEKTETNRYEIAIPKAGSLILTHDPNGLYPGLTACRQQRSSACGRRLLSSASPHAGSQPRTSICCGRCAVADGIHGAGGLALA